MPPKNDREWALYRCKASCRIGRQALDGDIVLPVGHQPIDWAMYNMLHAISEIATVMEIDGRDGGK
jgi:hypothetical protein